MKKMIELFNKICDNKYFPLVLILIAFLFLSVFSWSTSPFFTHDGMDSAVFKTMGQALLKGKVLYRDIFDHKGPYLYFINAFGQWLIPGRVGIFLLQVVGLSIALLCMFKTSKLFVKPSFAFISLLLSLFILGGHIQEGNQCEEWMMYSICISLYYVCFYFVKKSDLEHPFHYSIVYGLCFGFSFFIRPNDAVAWMGGFMIGVVLWLLYCKKYKNAVLNILCFFAGFLIMAIPVLIYFGCNGALSDLWYGLIGFNQEYSGGIKRLLLSSCSIGGGKMVWFLLLAIFVWLLYDTKYTKLLLVMFPACFMAIFLTGTNLFLHYFICITPFWLIFFTFFFLKSQKTYWTIAVFCLLIQLFDNYKGKFTAIGETAISWHRTGHLAVYEQAEHLFACVPESEIDSIWNNSLRWEWKEDVNADQSEFSVFCHYGIVPCNKITAGKNEQLANEDMVSKNRPKWIISHQHEDASSPYKKNEIEDSLFIASHYDIVAKSDTSVCKLILYKRR